MTLLEKVCLIISLLCLTALFSIQSKPPKDDHLAGPALTKLLTLHGVGIMECKNSICTFEREGKPVKVRL